MHKLIELTISQDRLDTLELFLESGYDPNTIGRNGHPRELQPLKF
jgi:hypothetical protein